ILWKDSSRYKEAAEKMRLTAEDLLDLKVIDKIIEEPVKYSKKDFEKINKEIRKEILNEIERMNKMSKEEITEERYKKFRNIMGFKEV
ncbi:MAG: acetyl-CoA carboxylase carboxyl transferase subunit alpha, partial [Clostridia bacterium]